MGIAQPEPHPFTQLNRLHRLKLPVADEDALCRFQIDEVDLPLAVNQRRVLPRQLTVLKHNVGKPNLPAQHKRRLLHDRMRGDDAVTALDIHGHRLPQGHGGPVWSLVHGRRGAELWALPPRVVPEKYQYSKIPPPAESFNSLLQTCV
mgnify:CR=1 FL=1